VHDATATNHFPSVLYPTQACVALLSNQLYLFTPAIVYRGLPRVLEAKISDTRVRESASVTHLVGSQTAEQPRLDVKGATMIRFCEPGSAIGHIFVPRHQPYLWALTAHA
jgi:hypothetical protein